ncbi:putative receptor-like protein kinase [Hordeum vulgare]|uniref:Protein kinase domain-containing protein n=1 Tax=Hordeum vulgare subsp. vulgare TaxID=112509 RepID=A0A8I6WET0_HORVV|nr:probable receptor-like protein kinase At1g49730 isoform X2 [Hordeum vulgare subsp. vulgare]KAE8820023.1 putative receptor-like protein kinase [Hordeum vulgare]
MRRPGPLLCAALAAAVALLAPLPPAAIAADCPLDFSWPNFALIASVCSDQNGHSKCCRYINAVLAVSSAMYANRTGTLGVPSELADACISNISDTFVSNGILPTAASFCGLGIKIQASYQCVGMTTILQMLKSPNFSDVTRNCATSLPDDVSCKKCLNSGLSYLRHLVGEQDNVTLNTCRDAAFVAFVSQGNISTLDTAGCFFSVQGLSALQGNISTSSPAGYPAPNISPSPFASQIPGKHVAEVPSNHHRSYKRVLFPAIGALVTGLSVTLLVVLILLIRRKSKELEKIEGINPLKVLSSCVKKGQEGTSTIFGRFSYQEMRKATRNFSTMLGGNDNATILKGQLSNGSVVAIKRIESSPKQDLLAFCKEMEFLGRLHHRHLVGLKGYCLTKFERFQVYEFMENGSLKDHLHSSGKLLLPWKNRIQIAIDVANALEYLHFYCDPPLYHGDIKPSNVLLDKNYLAKLAGCGIAHCSNGGNTMVGSTPGTVKIQATPGYVDPEYVVTQELTAKSDVYSYGVLLLELVTGRPVVQDDRSLVEWSRELIGTDYRLHELVDPAVADTFDLDELQVMADVIQWCTHKDGGARPSMKQLLRILYERLDPLSGGFARAVEVEQGYYYGGQSGRKAKEWQQHHEQRPRDGGGDVIQFSGEPRCLPSSSSTSRSHCSRTVPPEGNSPDPQSPAHADRGGFFI